MLQQQQNKIPVSYIKFLHGNIGTLGTFWTSELIFSTVGKGL